MAVGKKISGIKKSMLHTWDNVAGEDRETNATIGVGAVFRDESTMRWNCHFVIGVNFPAPPRRVCPHGKDELGEEHPRP